MLTGNARRQLLLRVSIMRARTKPQVERNIERVSLSPVMLNWKPIFANLKNTCVTQLFSNIKYEETREYIRQNGQMSIKRCQIKE